MNILQKIIGRVRNQSAGNGGMTLAEINDFFNHGQYQAGGPDISEITYFTCLKTLSEALGKLPIYLVDADKTG